MKSLRLDTAGLAVLIYLLAGAVWTVTVNFLLPGLNQNQSSPATYRIVSDLGILVITSLILFVSLRWRQTQEAKKGKSLAIQLAEVQNTSQISAAQRDQLNQSLNRITDGFLAVDADWRVTYINKRAAGLFGAQPDFLLGKNFWDAIPGAAISQLQQACQRARIENLQVYLEEYYPAVGAWCAESIYPSADGLSVYIADITRRKQTEDTLLENERKFRSIVRYSNDGISLTDEQGKVIEWNPASENITGISAADALKSNYWDLQFRSLQPQQKTQEEYDRLIRAIVEVLQTGKSSWLDKFWEVEIQRPDGSCRSVQDQIFLIKTEKGYMLGSISRDISIQKQAEEQLRKLNEDLEHRITERTAQLEAANKELEAFSYSVSHDLRAPLRSIEGFSSALVAECSAEIGEEGLHFIDRIQAANRDMNSLITSLLDLSRLTRRQMVFTRVDLSAQARKVADDLIGRDPSRNIDFQIQAGMVVEGDNHLLQVMLQNLLDNAWKYSSPRPHADVEIGKITQSGMNVFFVRDNGVGFNMDYAGNLFGAFQRLHSVAEFPGTGVGLATVQRIIHRHGGRIWAESVEGEGATFYFTLGEELTNGG
jgi:PAS domain S-box-containing protein